MVFNRNVVSLWRFLNISCTSLYDCSPLLPPCGERLKEDIAGDFKTSLRVTVTETRADGKCNGCLFVYMCTRAPARTAWEESRRVCFQRIYSF